VTGIGRGEALSAFAAEWLPRVESELLALLPPADEAPGVLHEAMRYALFPGGKRLRPLLVLAGCRVTGGDPARALPVAAGVECLHTYSLVHDDLPCMDDDDLRRGRPSCHRVYGEAAALLVGDALQALAFAAVAHGGALAVARIARAAGSRGMVGGQMADLDAEDGRGERSIARVEWIHDRKTGALITGCLAAGALAGAGGEAVPAEVMEPLERYGDGLGRAFQIVDDCLDLTGSAEELGKNPRADGEHGKLTWPAIVGLEPSLAMARQLAAAAAGLAPEVASRAGRWRGLALDDAAPLLQDLASAATERRS
jgi:geranylgeranyl diphosphate synthase type II